MMSLFDIGDRVKIKHPFSKIEGRIFYTISEVHTVYDGLGNPIYTYYKAKEDPYILYEHWLEEAK